MRFEGELLLLRPAGLEPAGAPLTCSLSVPSKAAVGLFKSRWEFNMWWLKFLSGYFSLSLAIKLHLQYVFGSEGSSLIRLKSLRLTQSYDLMRRFMISY